MLKRQIQWFITNGAVVALAVCGVVFEVEMAANAFKFLAWFGGSILIVGSLSGEVRSACRKCGSSVPAGLTLFVDVSLATLLAAYGWFGYATLIAVSGICSLTLYANSEKSEAAQATGDAEVKL